MFQHKSLPGKNYNYGAKTAIENWEAAREQFRKAHQYRNKLVELELARRRQTEELIKQLVPELSELTGKIDELTKIIDKQRAELKAKRQQSRKRVQDPEAVECLKQLKESRKPLYARLKELRKETFARQDIKDALQEVEKQHRATHKQARKDCGVFWGTYLVVEKAAGAFRRGAPPQFRPWRGEGQLAVQIQKGMTFEKLTACNDQRLRLDLTSRPERPTWAHLYLRVGSDEKRDPIFAVFPIKLHRQPPADALIKWVFVNRRIRAGQETITVTFSLARAAGWLNPDAATTGAVGIDIGWRKVPEGLRVAYWVDHAGQEGSLVLPQSRLEMLSKSEAIRSQRRLNFNDVMGFLLEAKQDGTPKPAWWTEGTKSVHLWKSFRALAGFVRFWSRQHADDFPEKHQLLTQLVAWYTRDTHLWRYEEGLRAGFQSWRQDLFRRFAADMRRRYAKIGLENFKITKLNRLDLPEAEDAKSSDYREAIRQASPGMLRRFLVETVREPMLVDPAYTTKTCHVCEFVDKKLDAAAVLSVTCPNCEETHDQDRRAAFNLLRKVLPENRDAA